jgi:dolichyl-diphosphooligosaccharide--protein glycosyltransferase
MRHLADYALVHAGPQETDLRISTHFARIGNSIFPDICGDSDPTCTKYGFVAGGQPSKMMKESFVYKAVKHGKEGVSLNPKLFEEVHSTKHGMIRIFKVLNVSQESKDWVANPDNKKCDAPGSWYCVGQYPPALDKLIAKRKNFAQLEDFNKKNQEKSAYTKMIEARQKKGQAEL